MMRFFYFPLSNGFQISVAFDNVANILSFLILLNFVNFHNIASLGFKGYDDFRLHIVRSWVCNFLDCNNYFVNSKFTAMMVKIISVVVAALVLG